MDGLSRHEMLEDIPDGMLQQVCKVRIRIKYTPSSFRQFKRRRKRATTYVLESYRIRRALFLNQKISMASRLLHTKIRFGYHPNIKGA